MVSGVQDRYREAVDKLLTLADFERKSRANQPPDWHLRRVERLMEMLGKPHLATPVVHVAGSKGKGSTCAMIASGLKAAGFRVGLYTSPHLHTFTERIKVNGENIPQSDFADLVDALWPSVDAIKAAGDLGVVSVFEMLTAMAFVHFRDHADIAVIETGLGGRLDATNVVDPEVSVITPISLDHVRILGNRISLIAKEKAGIIKPGKPVVVARNHAAAWGVIRERASDVGAEAVSACATTRVSDVKSLVADGFQQEFVIERWRQPRTLDDSHQANLTASALQPPPDPGLVDVRIQTMLLGAHQIDNARTAATTFNVLYRNGLAFDVNSAIKGISDTVWPCRTEIVDQPDRPLVVLDGAHNDASLKALRETIQSWNLSRRTNENGKRHGADETSRYGLIIGATEGHDHQKTSLDLAESAAFTIATQSRHPKSVHASNVALSLSRSGLEIHQCMNLDAALHEAFRLSATRSDIGLIIITGSLFVAAEAREHLLGIEPELYDDLAQPYISAYEDTVSTRDKIA